MELLYLISIRFVSRRLAPRYRLTIATLWGTLDAIGVHT